MPRVYVVDSEEEMTLVMANSQAQAISAVIKDKFECRAATAMDVVEYIKAGGEVEDANAAHEAQEASEGGKGEKAMPVSDEEGEEL